MICSGFPKLMVLCYRLDCIGSTAPKRVTKRVLAHGPATKSHLQVDEFILNRGFFNRAGRLTEKKGLNKDHKG